MPKFVLIDPSLQGIGGHHFEYAAHVLRAAEQAGFEPLLAANRKFRDTVELPPHWHVVSLYQHGAYSKRRILADNAVVAAAAPNRGWATRWLAAWWNDRRRTKRSLVFQRDTAALFRQVALEPGDQVFLATVSELEFLGLAQFLARMGDSQGVDWHLQFHFPIYAGYEPDYPAQDANLESLRRGFRKALALAGEHRLHCYTTTEGLAAQYNRLGVMPFHVLPYPANPALQASRGRNPSPGRPLRVSYLGDARSEKGYPQLPEIIDRVWTDYVGSNRIQFVIQSDCNFPQTDPESNVAVLDGKQALGRLPTEKITLLDAPLDSAEFTRHTLQCDIGLLPYQRSRLQRALLRHSGRSAVGRRADGSAGRHLAGRSIGRINARISRRAAAWAACVQPRHGPRRLAACRAASAGRLGAVSPLAGRFETLFRRLRIGRSDDCGARAVRSSIPGRRWSAPAGPTA